MIKRWKISLDGGANYDTIVTPINQLKFSWTNESGQIFKRQKLTTKMRFRGADYDLFYSWERTSVRRCNTIYIRQYRLCSGQWVVGWTGRFSAGSGRWDHAACEFEVLPTVHDKYSCILDAKNKQVNVLTLPNESARVKPTCIEFGVHLLSIIPGFPDHCYGHAYQPADVATHPSWTLIHQDHAITAFMIAYVYWREITETDCEAGVPVTPNGSGWNLLLDDCAGTGVARWWRVPATTADPCSNTFTDPTKCPDNSRIQLYDGTPVVDSCGVGRFNGLFVYICVPGYIPCTSVQTVNYTRGRWLHDAINLVLAETGCGDMRVRSDFFEWDPPGDVDGYVPGTNYVTGADNLVDELLIVQMSDALDPTASQPATVGKLSIAILLGLLASMRVFWDIDDDGNLRVEHIKHWRRIRAFTGPIVDADGPLAYEHNKSDIPSKERLLWNNAFLVDFVGADIEYHSPCTSSAGDSVEETRVQEFMTDIFQVQLSDNGLGQQGFMVLATWIQGTTRYVINDVGALSGLMVPNAPMSTANLMRDFWTWDRYLLRGEMNGEDVVFDAIVPNIKQVDVRAQFCCGMEDFDGLGTVATELGLRYLNGREGYVESAVLDDATDQLTMILLYAY